MSFICENIKCKKEHDGSFGSGRFCCRSCANIRNFSDEKRAEINKKKSDKLKGKRLNYNTWTQEARKKAKESLNKYYENIRNKTEYSLLGHASRKIILFKKQEGKCNKCKNDTWLGIPISLELEHKDGNSENHIKDNEELLCPNCHSQTHTYRGKNKRSNIGNITDERLMLSLKNNKNISQALTEVGLAPKGANYKRCKLLLEEMIKSS